MRIPLLLLALTVAARGALVDDPSPPLLSPAGLALIHEQEGFDAHPALPPHSGPTISWGYDLHETSKSRILNDWAPLPAPAPTRLADLHPYYGPSARPAVQAAHDIMIPRSLGDRVFIDVDVAIVFADCRRIWHGFNDLHRNAQSALASIVFNRGSSLLGPSRSEMRAIVPLVASRDYAGIAAQVRAMKRIWTGTSIQHDMYSRREAEAKLIETP